VQEDKKEEQKEEEPNTETAGPSAPEAAKKAAEAAKPAEKTPDDIIREKESKINELTDKYLRSLAELDNYRKRVQKDKEELFKYSKSEAISVFLPVVDNFERAVAAADKIKDFEQLKKGVEMVLKQFESALKELGAKEIPTNGVFDPLFHHAMHKEAAPGKKDGEILEVYQKGYMIDDKMVRPAMVKIAHNDEHKNHEHKNHDHK
jgi:molecular chaperone GrpE